MTIPFYKPHISGNELKYISDVFTRGKLSGNGFYTKKCNSWLKHHVKCDKALLTNSCTDALEMASLLLDIKEGDEVIMPSYTFVSTANAFVLKGAIPVFIDIRSDTLNMDENLIESAITKKTKAIVPVHYAGVGCEMDKIINIAKQYELKIVEDAAQAIQSTYKGKSLGSIGDMGVFSFHETKNIICGEGGALSVNNYDYLERSEILIEKGTNRSVFLKGEVDKYTWVDKGSSYLPSEQTAAFLWAQLEKSRDITDIRNKIWNLYHEKLFELERLGILRRPYVPNECDHNSHMYYILLASNERRNNLISFLKNKGVQATFHYIPLHASPAGKIYAKYNGSMKETEHISDTIIRLPLYVDMSIEDVQKVVDYIIEWSQ